MKQISRLEALKLRVTDESGRRVLPKGIPKEAPDPPKEPDPLLQEMASAMATMAEKTSAIVAMAVEEAAKAGVSMDKIAAAILATNNRPTKLRLTNIVRDSHNLIKHADIEVIR